MSADEWAGQKDDLRAEKTAPKRAAPSAQSDGLWVGRTAFAWAGQWDYCWEPPKAEASWVRPWESAWVLPREEARERWSESSKGAWSAPWSEDWTALRALW
jgi:hypothetical protein